MKTGSVSKTLLAGLAFSLLFGAVSSAAQSQQVARATVSRVAPASNARAQARPAASFRTERTDSWLCVNISPLFCSTMFPSFESKPGTPSASPARGRN
jgi:hypothetical protein